MPGSEPARPAAYRTRSIVLAAVAVVIATLGGVFLYQEWASAGGSGGPNSSLSYVSAPSSAVLGRPGRAGVRGEAAAESSSQAVVDTVPAAVWPAGGQAAFIQTGQSQIQAGPNQHVAPIASVAKVMTAYVVLHDHLLSPGADGPMITLTAADVADTAARQAQDQSVVTIAAGEQLTEQQALEALLLPSANNIAAVLANWDAGSLPAFVAEMNSTARSLGMTSTTYTDPSGFDQATVSTAVDQVRIIEKATALPVFASIVAMPNVALPVAGTVRNTDKLLGHDGFVGVKTGSDGAAGGCFAFQAIRVVNGKQTTITGVVLGQPGAAEVAAGLSAADAFVNRIAGQ